MNPSLREIRPAMKVLTGGGGVRHGRFAKFIFPDEPEDGLEPIAEFPAFSFILGDLHPHVLALPFALLSLALALVWWLQNEAGEKAQELAESWDRCYLAGPFANIDPFHQPPCMAVKRRDTWWIILLEYLGCADLLCLSWPVLFSWLAGAITAGTSASSPKPSPSTLLLLLPIILLYLPFYVGFRSQAGAPYLLPQLMRPTRLVQYLVIFGMPLWVITILLIAQAARQRFRYWKTGLAAAVSLILYSVLLTFFFGLIVAISPEGAGRVIALANELGITLAPRPEGNIALGWGFMGRSGHCPRSPDCQNHLSRSDLIALCQ